MKRELKEDALYECLAIEADVAVAIPMKRELKETIDDAMALKERGMVAVAIPMKRELKALRVPSVLEELI